VLCLSLIGAVAALSMAGIAPGSAAAQVSLAALDTPYAENFNTLPASGSATWMDNSTILGWYHARTGTGTNIVADIGSNSGGNLYSYGTATASDRALGSVGSSAAGDFYWGVRVQNNTGARIRSLDVSYTGEQWRNSAAAAQTVSFSYLVGSPTVTGSLAEFQTAGVAVPSLDFTSPVTGGTASALDGNAAPNRTAKTFTITGLSVPAGGEVMLRWSDPNHAGSDHGLSIDDLSVTPHSGEPDLMTTVTASPDQVNVGDDITYTIKVANGGTGATSAASLTSGIPHDTTFVSSTATNGFACTGPSVGSGGTLICNGALVPGAETTITLVVNVASSATPGEVITDVATASDPEDPNSENNSGSASSTVAPTPPADLGVGQTDTPDPVAAGGDITYHVTITSSGPADASNASLNYDLDSKLEFVSLQQNSGPTGTCTEPGVGSSGSVVCSWASLPAGASATFTLIAHVNSSTSPGTLLTNHARVASARQDPNPENDTSAETTNVAGSADMSITKSGAATATAGTNLTYTVTVSNAGPDSAVSATWQDTLPAALQFVSLKQDTGPTASCTTPAAGSSGLVSCSLGTLPNAGSAQFTLVVRVRSSASGSVSNTATVSVTDSVDPNGSNNSSTAMTTVTRSADLSATKSAPASVVAGTDLTYTVVVGSNGPSDATSVTLDDPLPAGTTFVSTTEPAGFSCTHPAVGAGGTVNCTASTLATGASRTFTIVVHVDPSSANGSTISNTATVSSSTPDPSSSNDFSTVGTTVGTSADLATTVTDESDPVSAVNNIVYTVTLANSGPSDAQTVGFTDQVPSGTTFVSATQESGPTFTCTVPASGGTGTVSCSIATLPAGATASFKITVAPGGSGTISNSATATSTTSDPNSANNTDTESTTVTPAADLAVTVGDAPDPVVAGTDLTYTIGLSNGGPSAADGVTLTDDVPAGTKFVSLSAPAGFSCTTPAVGATGTVSCTASSLAAGASPTVTLVVRVDQDRAQDSAISNTATAATTTSDPASGNNSATASTTVNARADLATTISDSPDPVVAGEVVTYRVGLHNAGPSDAAAPKLTLPLPAGTTFVSASQASGPAFDCAADAAKIACDRATLPVGGDATFDFAVRTTAGDGGSIEAKPAASAGTTDPDPSNNERTETTTVTQTPTPPDTSPKIKLGKAVMRPRSGVIFVPITCASPATGVCDTTLTVTFKKPYQRFKPITLKLRQGIGTAQVYVAAPRGERQKIRRIRRLPVTLTATNPPGPPVTRDSVLIGRPSRR
jgi:uncharacterized repeat protein (TIGR01451 family)